MPLMAKDPNPSTVLVIGVKLMKSLMQCVKAAVAPVSMMMEKELVSKDVVQEVELDVKAHKYASKLIFAIAWLK